MNELELRRRAMMGVRKARLPSAYQETEYIQSISSTFIKLGVNDSNPDLEIEASFSDIQGSGYRYIIGCWSNDQENNTIIYINTADAIGAWVTKSYTSWAMIPIDVMQKHTVRVNSSAYYLDGNLAANSFDSGDNRVGAELYVFRRNGANGTAAQTASVSAKLYSLSIEDSGVPIRNMVPCRRKTDNKPGMYDLCGSICPLTGTPFYINAGTGDFTLGRKV